MGVNVEVESGPSSSTKYQATRTGHANAGVRSLGFLPALGFIVVTAAAYGVAFATARGAAAVLVALPCICLLASAGTARRAFYFGLLAGLAAYVPHLWFFETIFGPAAAALWLVAAAPVAVFVLLLHLSRRRFGPMWACCLTPMLWTGVEYFRSELYYLRFSWIQPGQAAAFLPGVRWMSVGVYGLGFLFALAAAMTVYRRPVVRTIGVMMSLSIAAMMYYPRQQSAPPPAGSVMVAGVQLEHASESDVAGALDRLAIEHPDAQILVLSEYTYRGPVPQPIRDLVRRHHRYLVAGGVRWLGDGRFRDTAFVVGPDGQDVFEQAKSVPVQFMGDGLPAIERRVWESPWGKIGIPTCYDVSYTRVTDDFVRQGAQGLIIPTMDLESWGEYERRMLHGRLAPVRSAEYGIPVFGVWSSGVSQLTDNAGHVIATAGYPGQGATIAGPFDLRLPGRVPPDRVLAMAATVATGVLIVLLVVMQVRRRMTTWRSVGVTDDLSH